MQSRTKSKTADYLIRQLPSATAFINTSFEVVHASDQWLDSFDISARDTLGRTVFEIFGQKSETWRTVLENCFAGLPVESDLDQIDLKNKDKWFQWTHKPWYDQKENIIGAIVLSEDVTEKVITKNKTKEDQQLLKSLVDNLPMYIYVNDRESRKILVNQAICDFLGVKDQTTLLGKSDKELFGEGIGWSSREEDLQVMSTLEPVMRRESTYINDNGETTTLMVSKIPLIGSDNKVRGLISLSLDISDRKQKEEELRGLINVTAQQNKKLINFAHIVSHNLRSHTANFSMLLELLINEKDDAERNKIIMMLTESSDNLLETLDNLNEVVAINTNTNLDKKPICLAAAVNKVMENLTGFLKNNNARITNEIPAETNVNAVPTYLDSILMNFITNGIQYKDPNRAPVVKLSIEKKSGYTILLIEDNGLGIDLDKYGNKLFGMYKTFHDNKDARGIGLYIAKNQIEAMKGKVSVQSVVGKGTIFKIYFNGES